MTRREANAVLLGGAVLAVGPALACGKCQRHRVAAAKQQGRQAAHGRLALRRSTRAYSDRPLPLQVISDLLWAAFGINRLSGDRTAPYRRHIVVHGEGMQDISPEDRRLYGSADSCFIG